jgi:hypothetical protein
MFFNIKEITFLLSDTFEHLPIVRLSQLCFKDTSYVGKEQDYEAYVLHNEVHKITNVFFEIGPHLKM